MPKVPAEFLPFTRRVRIVRAWRDGIVGMGVGAGVATVWSTLDYFNLAVADWRWLIGVTLVGGALGGFIGALRSVPLRALTESIDRRAELEDRLTTANEFGDPSEFSDALRHDAKQHLRNLRPKTLYPIRVGRWHGATLLLCLMASAIFLLGNTPLLLNEEAKRNREMLRKEGQKVERITRETVDSPEAKAEMSEAEKRLADEMRRYQRELERARLRPEEAMQKANEIAAKADELMRQTAKNSESTLNDAQKALEQMQRDKLTQAGMPNVDPQLAAMSPQEMANQEQAAQESLSRSQNALNQLQNQLDLLNQKLKDPKLSEAERKALEQQKRELQRKMDDAKKSIEKAKQDLQALKLAKKAAELMKRLMANPLYKELQELAKKMKQNAADAQGGRPSISDEDRARLKAELEELMAQLKSDADIQRYLEALKRAMSEAGEMRRCNKIGFSLPFPVPGTGMPGNGVMLQDIGKVNHSPTALPSQGSTNATMISGEQRAGVDDQPYVEIKAPSTVGNRSAIPYVKVLPSYRKKAESALNRQEIPKEQEKRVREYFESLGTGR